MIGRALLLAAALAIGCQRGPHDYLVVHHRANGCAEGTPENSLAGVRCVVEECRRGVGPCALEVDLRILRVRGGSLGGDLEIVVMHDGSTARTALCPAGDLALPGDVPIEPGSLAACRLLLADDDVSEEPLPRFDDLLGALAGGEVTAFLELKTSGDATLDRRLAEATVDRLGPLRPRVVVASFDAGALALVRARDPGVRTACFAPGGRGLRQVVTALRGGVLGDVDACLRGGHDHVFVPPACLDAQVVRHVRHRRALLGVFGADTADGHDVVSRWGHRIDVVYADRPSMYGAR